MNSISREPHTSVNCHPFFVTSLAPFSLTHSSMGKKNKADGPSPSSVPNRDIIQRLNFLYQASTYLNVLHAQNNPQHVSQPIKPTGKSETESNSLSGTSEKVKPENQDHNGGSTKNQDMCKRPGKRKASTQDIARNYLKSMKVIGQKTNVKMYFVLILRLWSRKKRSDMLLLFIRFRDPSVKRTLCLGCNNVLISGVTAKVRVRRECLAFAPSYRLPRISNFLTFTI